MASNDIVINNIKKQLALNAGQLNISSTNGSYSFVDTTNNTTLPGSANASNYVLSNVPSTYQSGLKAEVYNYAKGVFGGQTVPPELVESLSSLATYYVSQTGVSVQSLFKNGQLQSNFLATINTFLNDSVQFGYQSLNTTQPWVNNPTLHGNIAAALQSSLK